MAKTWVVVAAACRDCGSDTAIRILSTEPTDKQLEEVRDALGGMFCIQTNVVQTDIDGEIVMTRGDH